MQTFKSTCCIRANHPALSGHFPGNPVVPGVVILDCILQALDEIPGKLSLVQIRDTKFISPLLPEQTMSILIGIRDEKSATFECRTTDRLIAQGNVSLQRNIA